jgi:hypothetical protein
MTVREADEYLFGEEWARINALPLEQRIEVLCDYWDSFDTAADLFWPEEPPPGAVGRARFPLWDPLDLPKPVTPR